MLFSHARKHPDTKYRRLPQVTGVASSQRLNGPPQARSLFRHGIQVLIMTPESDLVIRGVLSEH